MQVKFVVFFQNNDGPETVNIDFSGDVRTGTVIEEHLTIDVATFQMSVWVRAWGQGAGTVSFSWDGVEDCNYQGGSNCVPCSTFTCPNAQTSVCFGAYEPECVADDEAELKQITCDDYKTDDILQPCNTIVVPLPECLTASPTVNPTVGPTVAPTGHPTTTVPTVGPTKSPTHSPTLRNICPVVFKIYFCNFFF